MDNKNKKPKKCRSVYALNNDEATVVWIIGMLISTIFKGNWMMWIVLTIWYVNYISE